MPGVGRCAFVPLRRRAAGIRSPWLCATWRGPRFAAGAAGGCFVRRARGPRVAPGVPVSG